MIVKNSYKIITVAICTILTTACGDNPFHDNTPINDNDYAMIRIEMNRCNHITKEGSWASNLHFSPRMACLNHLKKRIVHTGKATAEGLEQ